MLPDVPPMVEGRIPTQEEMDAKARNGRYYLDDVWLVEREFPTACIYKCETDLPNLVDTLYPEVKHIGYILEDASYRFDKCIHALHLTLEWASLVREARTTNKMFLVRRTPENSGAMLMIQRQEHLRGQCTEMAPLAYVVLVRDAQMVVTRDRVTSQDTTERILVAMAKHKDERITPKQAETEDTPDTLEAQEKGKKQSLSNYLDEQLKEEGADGVGGVGGDDSIVNKPPRVPNMPAPLFNQQMRAVHDLMKALGVDSEERVEEVEEVYLTSTVGNEEEKEEKEKKEEKEETEENNASEDPVAVA